eukprot:2936115-Alexandrium_andersonii.AAC.1
MPPAGSGGLRSPWVSHWGPVPIVYSSRAIGLQTAASSFERLRAVSCAPLWGGRFYRPPQTNLRKRLGKL